MSKESDKRIDDWLDGELDEEGRKELSAWIVESPENAAVFAERSHLHSRLFDWAKAIGSCGVDEVADSVAESVVFNSPKIRWQVKAIAAGVVVTLVSVFLFSPEKREVPGEPLAKLGDSSGAQLLYRGRAMSEGETVMRAGEYRLNQGMASVEYATGVQLLIEAPAVFRMVSQELVELSEGRVAAHVPPEGIGFKIDTPSAEVVDFGTDFAVDVGLDRASEVHVFNGEVAVQPRKGKVDPVRLLTNGATRIGYDSDIPLGIPVDNDRFLRSLDEPSIEYSQLIRTMNPVLYYRMGVPKDGSRVKDAAGDADGEMINQGALRPAFSTGKVGSAGRFTGSRDSPYVTTPDYPKSGGQLSVSTWVYARSWPRLACIAANDQEDLLGQFRMGLYRDTGIMRVRVRDADNKEVIVHDTEALPLERWHHIAFVADGTTLRLFRNGREVAAVPCGLIGPTKVANLFIGAQDNREGDIIHFWHGRIDEVAVFNHALTDKEIAQQVRSVPPR